ncbi:hypothetical protein OOU_Y34scaffold00168g2 [Pyricularia oryzae Y34]|uniref:Uncharacterized protein n=2 Tax=Pyricularia oryzae TaxID=318829 RepID=A0AA97P6Y3_PYRO3|nr:hypothetical protein OOU_Y34scaffold00168g2 [Pyricularia oryzae Y34]
MRNEKDEKEHGPALPKSYAKKNMATTEASPTETRPTEKPAVVRMTFDPERHITNRPFLCRQSSDHCISSGAPRHHHMSSRSTTKAPIGRRGLSFRGQSASCTGVVASPAATNMGSAAGNVRARWKASNSLLLPPGTGPETETPTTGPDSRTTSSSDRDLQAGAKAVVAAGVVVFVVVFVVVLVILSLAMTGKRWKGKKVEGGGRLPR